MNIYATEEEQVAQIRKWFKEYGTFILLTVVIVLLLGYGWRTWHNIKTERAQHASELYNVMLNDVNDSTNDNSQTAETYAKQIIREYSSTPYAVYSSLFLARQAVFAGKYAQAQSNIEWAIKHTDSEITKQLSQVRLAKVFIAQNKSQDSLDILNSIPENSVYLPIANELKGDTYALMKKNKLAIAAYKKALAEFPKSDAKDSDVVRMKYEQLSHNDSERSVG